MQNARVSAKPVPVSTTGNLLTVAFDTFANLLLVAVVFMVLYAAAGTWIRTGVDAVIDPSGDASATAYHMRAVFVALAFVAAIGAVYFVAGWRRFHSSLGLRMMRVFGVLPRQPRFPAVQGAHAYVWRYAVPTVVAATLVVAVFVFLA